MMCMLQIDPSEQPMGKNAEGHFEQPAWLGLGEK